MRVGLNATCFNYRPSGATQRFVGLYGRLIAANPDVEFVVYEPSDTRVAQFFAGASNVRARVTPIPSGGRVRKVARSLGYWRHTLRADRLSLFEQFNLPLVKAPDCPTILTVHDIRDAYATGMPLLRHAYRTIWHRALSGADHVITVSDTMREEVLRFHPGVPITTIYNGVDAAPFKQAVIEASVPYLLAVGHLEPRKNYDVLITALALLRQRGCAMPLIIIGRDGGSLSAIKAKITALGLNKWVTIRHDVDTAALASLYRGAALVVFPSLYEGFGIPLIEAMAAGRPLVVSDIPVFRELSEDRVLFFDPHDPTALADNIMRVHADPALAASIAAYGRDRVGDFAFDVLAEQMVHLYRRLLSAQS
jgi:glycosyltransferase involved in cell wall biosynthesis